MIDYIILFPYWITLKLRHLLFDLGIRKSNQADVPTICVGNVTVGGTGKTPHTEMILKLLLEESIWKDEHIAVLSRGYKRSTRWFQQVVADGCAKDYGDEPLQIKRKFPQVTVAVDKSRVRGCSFLSDRQKLISLKKSKKCKDGNYPDASLIVLDDAFQYRKLKADLSIVLIDSSRPVFKDHLLPVGSLRDLPERVRKADVVIVTKCPRQMNAWEKYNWAEALGLSGYDSEHCTGKLSDGKVQHLFFTSITYDSPLPVFPQGDSRYLYAKRLVLFSGIANDKPLVNYLCDKYKIVGHFKYGDHHSFTKGDIAEIASAAKAYPTSVVMTTEKDSQRLRDVRYLDEDLKTRIFYVPIKAQFTSEREKEIFLEILDGLKSSR